MKQWIVAGLIHFDSIEPMKQHVQKKGFDFNEIVSEKKIYIKSINGNIPLKKRITGKSQRKKRLLRHRHF